MSLSPLSPVETTETLLEPLEQQPHLILVVEGEPYACPIGAVERLLRYADAPVRPSAASAPQWETGRLALPEEPAGVPVVSLRALWNLAPVADAVTAERQALVVVQTGGRRWALEVDSCRSVVTGLPAPAERFALPRALKGTTGSAFQSVVPWGGALLVVLDIQALLNEEGAPARSGVPLQS